MNWLITGVSSGFGRALSELILEKGGKVAGTVRKDADKAEFEKLARDRLRAEEGAAPQQLECLR